MHQNRQGDGVGYILSEGTASQGYLADLYSLLVTMAKNGMRELDGSVGGSYGGWSPSVSRKGWDLTVLVWVLRGFFFTCLPL